MGSVKKKKSQKKKHPFLYCCFNFVTVHFFFRVNFTAFSDKTQMFLGSQFSMGVYFCTFGIASCCTSHIKKRVQEAIQGAGNNCPVFFPYIISTHLCKPKYSSAKLGLGYSCRQTFTAHPFECVWKRKKVTHLFPSYVMCTLYSLDREKNVLYLIYLIKIQIPNWRTY